MSVASQSCKRVPLFNRRARQKKHPMASKANATIPIGEGSGVASATEVSNSAEKDVVTEPPPSSVDKIPWKLWFENGRVNRPVKSMVSPVEESRSIPAIENEATELVAEPFRKLSGDPSGEQICPAAEGVAVHPDDPKIPASKNVKVKLRFGAAENVRKSDTSSGPTASGGLSIFWIVAVVPSSAIKPPPWLEAGELRVIRFETNSIPALDSSIEPVAFNVPVTRLALAAGATSRPNKNQVVQAFFIP